MLEPGECLEEIRDAFAQADLAGEEELEGIWWWVFGAGELIEADTVGDDVDFFCGDSHRYERTLRYGGRHGDGIGERIDFFFAYGDVGFAEGLGHVPAAVLVCDDVFLIALVRRASIADESSAVGLHLVSREQAGAGDGDEGVAGGDSTAGPLVEGEGVPGVHLRGEGCWIEARVVEQVVCRVKERKGADEGAGEAFALQPSPGPGGVDLLKMPFSAELVCQFKVVIDTKDCQGDLHGILCPQLPWDRSEFTGSWCQRRDGIREL